MGTRDAHSTVARGSDGLIRSAVYVPPVSGRVRVGVDAVTTVRIPTRTRGSLLPRRRAGSSVIGPAAAAPLPVLSAGRRASIPAPVRLGNFLHAVAPLPLSRGHRRNGNVIPSNCPDRGRPSHVRVRYTAVTVDALPSP